MLLMKMYNDFIQIVIVCQTFITNVQLHNIIQLPSFITLVESFAGKKKNKNGNIY